MEHQRLENTHLNPQARQQPNPQPNLTNNVAWPPVRNFAPNGQATVRLAHSDREPAYTTTSSGPDYSGASGGVSFSSALRQYHYPTTSTASTSTSTNTISTSTTAIVPISTVSTSTTTMQPPNLSSAVNLYHLLTSQISNQLNSNAFGSSSSATTTTPIGPGVPEQSVLNIPDSATNRETSVTTSGERWMRMAANSRRASDMAAVRRQFRGKVVCNLSCGDCGVLVCKRGMKAILLADTTVELFSTDSPPIGVQMVNDDYETRNCHCRIRDVACLNCGNHVGYHVTQPCTDCLSSCNNGHFWMFHMEQVISEDRMDGTGNKALLWAHLPRESDEVRSEMMIYEAMCR